MSFISPVRFSPSLTTDAFSCLPRLNDETSWHGHPAMTSSTAGMSETPEADNKPRPTFADATSPHSTKRWVKLSFQTVLMKRYEVGLLPQANTCAKDQLQPKVFIACRAAP